MEDRSVGFQQGAPSNPIEHVAPQNTQDANGGRRWDCGYKQELDRTDPNTDKPRRSARRVGYGF